MDFVEIMQTYFRGERLEGLFYILPSGILLLAMAATALVSYRDGFGWGMAIPLALFGLVMLGVGLGLAIRTPPQLAALEHAYHVDPAAMVAEELPRMHKVNANWPKIIAVWTALVIVGLGLRMLVSADWAHGLGVALMACGVVGFFIDGFAERRSPPYTAALEALAQKHGQQHGVQPGGSNSSQAVSITLTAD